MNEDISKLGFSTKAVHAGVEPDPSCGAIMTPIFQTSTYVQSSPGEHQGYDYTRAGNPTRDALESSIAALEGASRSFVFASGCNATDTILHLLDSGDHVVSIDDVYGGTGRLFRTVWARHGLSFSFEDLTQTSVTEFMKPNTKMIWLETPTNPTLKVIDIEKVVTEAKAKNPDVLIVVDNTFASPYFQNPLALGADIVMHSTTKYINGHSDVVGGAIAVNSKDLEDRLFHLQLSVGGGQSPFDCFLVLRGIKTLAIRMQRASENAAAIAKFLEDHPKIDRVLYPGLSSHPQHDVAKKQMKGFGGMITFFVKGGLEESRSLLERVKVFALAESLGGVESLIEHPAIMTHASVPPEMREKLGISDTLIRLSVGIENEEDLIKDLNQALGD